MSEGKYNENLQSKIPLFFIQIIWLKKFQVMYHTWKLELKTVQPYLLTKHSLPDNSASVVGISDFERRNSVGSHVALACNFGLQKATSSFFLVNLTYKFNKTAETTQYKFSKKKELTIMYPKFHKDNFIRSTFVTSQQVPAATKVFSHSGLNFKCVWDIFSAWSSRYGFRKWVGLDRPCPTNFFFSK